MVYKFLLNASITALEAGLVLVLLVRYTQCTMGYPSARDVLLQQEKCYIVMNSLTASLVFTAFC